MDSRLELFIKLNIYRNMQIGRTTQERNTIGANSCYTKGEELDEKRLDRAERNAKSRIYKWKITSRS